MIITEYFVAATLELGSQSPKRPSDNGRLHSVTFNRLPMNLPCQDSAKALNFSVRCFGSCRSTQPGDLLWEGDIRSTSASSSVARPCRRLQRRLHIPATKVR